MRQPLRVGAHPCGETAIPGIGGIFVGNKFPVKTFNLHRAVGDGNIGIDRRLAKIKAQFGIRHE
ncbi:hypothetical protein D3C83_256640 [compost metagenome]